MSSGPPYLETAVPKWDTLDYEALEAARRRGELPPLPLDYRPRLPERLADSAALAIGAALLLAPLAYLWPSLGSLLLSPLLQPFVAAAILVGSAYVFFRTRRGAPALAAVLAVLALLLGAAAFGLRDESPAAVLFSLYVALAAAALVVDALGTHAVAWALASPALEPRARTLALEAWSLRFRPRALREHASPFARELVDYAAGYWILALLLLLALVPRALPLLLLVPGASALLWCYRRSPAPPPRSIRDALLEAIHGWLQVGRRAERAPGVFQSPIGRRRERLALVFVALLLLAAAFAPPLLVRGVFSGSPAPLWQLLATLLAAAALPLLLFGALALSALGRVLPALTTLPRRDTAQPELDLYLDRLAQAPAGVARDQLLLGFHAEEDYPIVLPLSILGHAHIMGSTGSGKTTRAIAPLLAQLIRRSGKAAAPVVILDLKGDTALFHGVRLEAERAGRAFRFFTNLPDRATHLFNPLRDLQASPASVNQVCELVLSALNLEHGSGYGRSYFSIVARDWLSTILHDFPGIRSFEELDELGKQKANFREQAHRDHAFELLANVRILGRFPSLNLSSESKAPELLAHAIHTPTVLEEDQVVYFFLASGQELATSRQIAGLALYAFYTACAERRPAKRAFLFIDEFQRVAGRNFEILLEQARSSGLSMFLSNQSLSQLETPDVDLRATVSENTEYRQYFTARSEEALEHLRRLSGETHYVGTFYDGLLAPRPRAADTAAPTYLGPRFSANDILRMSSDPELALAVLPTDRDYARFGGHFFPLRSPFHIGRSEYERRTALPWPDGAPGTFVPPKPEPALHRPEEPTSPRPADGTPLSDRFETL